MKVFLLTLSIVDDIGAIAVIAIFYTDDLSLGWLLVAVALIVLILLMRLVRIWYIPIYVLAGAFLWLAVFESGIHATIAGVVLGLMTPAIALKGDAPADDVHVGAAVSGRASVTVLRRASFEIREQVSVAERLDEVLHPFSSFLIIPVFALVNAGIEIGGDTFTDALSSRVTIGVVAGLVLGKLLGISTASWLAVKSGTCPTPARCILDPRGGPFVYRGHRFHGLVVHHRTCL